jgi:hypothetical protein
MRWRTTTALSIRNESKGVNPTFFNNIVPMPDFENDTAKFTGAAVAAVTGLFDFEQSDVIPPVRIAAAKNIT